MTPMTSETGRVSVSTMRSVGSVGSMGARIAVALLEGYKRVVSPLLPPACRYTPTCSDYARDAIDRYGLARGAAFGLKRLARCHPFRPGGHDPVP